MSPPLEVEGFTSRRNAHAHLLKHVLRLTEQESTKQTNLPDPERWAGLIGEPPLATSVDARRKQALALLSRVEGCPAGQLKKPSREKVCAGCQNRSARHVVSSEMKTLLDAYTDVARQTLAECGRSPQLTVTYRSDCGFVIDATDSRKVRVIAALDETRTRARLVSCYRTSDSLKQRAMEYGRRRASYARRGQLLEGE